MNQIEAVLNAIHFSCQAARMYDERPGLKFLVQKVAQFESATNLYRQSSSCWTLHMLCLYEIVLLKLKFGLDRNQISSIIEKKKSEVEIDKETMLFVELLGQAFSDLGEIYENVVSRCIDTMDEKNEEKSSSIMNVDRNKISVPFVHLISEDDSSKSEKHSLFSPTEGEIDPKASSLPITMTLGASLVIEDEEPIENPFNETQTDCSLQSCSSAESNFDPQLNNLSKVIDDFRWRKSKHSMPSKHLERKCNPFNDTYKPPKSRSVPPEIEEQQTESLLKVS